MKNSENVNDFKASLDSFKNNCKDCSDNHFWEVSNLIIDKIEGPNYLENKEKFNAFLMENPIVAKWKGINIKQAIA